MSKEFRIVKAYGQSFHGFDMPIGSFYGVFNGQPWIVTKRRGEWVAFVLAIKSVPTEYGSDSEMSEEERRRKHAAAQKPGYNEIEYWRKASPRVYTSTRGFWAKVQSYLAANPAHTTGSFRHPRPIFFNDCIRRGGGATIYR